MKIIGSLFGRRRSGESGTPNEYPSEPYYPETPVIPETPEDSTVSLESEQVVYQPIPVGKQSGGLRNNLPNQPRNYSAWIKITENGVPYYCIIPVRDSFSSKAADARITLRDCVFYADNRSNFVEEERRKTIPLKKKLSIPITLYLAPFPKSNDQYNDELFLYANGDNVSFSVSFNSTYGEFLKEGLTEFRLDPNELYHFDIKDQTAFDLKEYSFEISFCKAINGYDFDVVSAFTPQ